jgi:hypothetical protein
LKFILCLLPGGPGLAQTALVLAVEIAFGQNAIDRSNAIIKAWPDRQKRSVAADRL